MANEQLNFKEMSTSQGGAIRALIVESGHLAMKDGGKLFPLAYRQMIINAVQEYNEKVTLEANGEPLITSGDF